MIEIIGDLGAFIIKAIVIVASIIVLTSFFVSLALKQKEDQEGFSLKNLTKQLHKTTLKLKSSFLNKKDRKALLKAEKKDLKGNENKTKNKVFIIDFEGDIKASGAESLKKCVTQCINLLDPAKDEVVIRLESPGGMVSGYGLAASELSRLREANIKLTICVDKVAASGGYLMSCVADQILVAPFAILGSIGVVAGMPNVHKLLKKNDIEYDVLTAGKFKRTLTVFGENTPEGKEKFIEQLEQIHNLFKSFVSKYRPKLDIEEVATGEYWFGEDALNLKLADKIQTSEDYILDLVKEKEVFILSYNEKKKLTDRLMESAKANLFKGLSPSDFF